MTDHRSKKTAALISLLALTAFAAPAGAEESVDEKPYVSAATNAKATANNACSICHGAQGVSKWDYIPSLAGQDKDYIVDQLKGMRERKRTTHYSQAAMWGMAANLNDEDISALADFYAGLDPARGHPDDAKTLELGKRVFERREVGRPSCTTCHFGGHGNANLPRLAGQHAEYVERTLHDFKEGFRINGTMTYMAARLTDEEMRGVAAYVASLDVPAAAGVNAQVAAGTSESSPIDRGREVFQTVGCYQCHGEAGKGGVSNPNAVGGLVPTLTLVSQGYSDAELKNKIRLGVRYVAKADSSGPTPPLFMPAWGKFLTDRQLDDLVAYLKSLAAGKQAQDF
jgi:cytochrome c553